jgi:hypothetical protein
MALEFDLFFVEGILYVNGSSSTDLLAVVSGFVTTSQESPSESCSLNCHCLKMQCQTDESEVSLAFGVFFFFFFFLHSEISG